MTLDELSLMNIDMLLCSVQFFLSHLTGPVPWDALCGPLEKVASSIQYLVLSYNQLTGSIDISSCDSLIMLDVTVGRARQTKCGVRSNGNGRINDFRGPESGPLNKYGLKQMSDFDGSDVS